MATLTITRDSGWADRARKYRVLVDGSEVSRLGNGATFSCELLPGRHTVQARIDWCGSRVVHIDLTERGCTVHLRSALRGWRMFVAVWYVLFDRDGYVVAEESPEVAA